MFNIPTIDGHILTLFCNIPSILSHIFCVLVKYTQGIPAIIIIYTFFALILHEGLATESD